MHAPTHTSEPLSLRFSRVCAGDLSARPRAILAPQRFAEISRNVRITVARMLFTALSRTVARNSRYNSSIDSDFRLFARIID